MNVYAQNRQQLVALGDSCMREYDFFHAIQHYQQAQQIRTENKVRLKLAECFYQRNDYHGCSDVLDKVPSDSLNHNALRQLYYSNYYCPLNFWLRYKFRADTSHEVSALFVIFAFVPKLR